MWSVAFGIAKYAAASSMVRIERAAEVLDDVVLIMCSFASTTAGWLSQRKVCISLRLPWDLMATGTGVERAARPQADLGDLSTRSRRGTMSSVRKRRRLLPCALWSTPTPLGTDESGAFEAGGRRSGSRCEHFRRAPTSGAAPGDAIVM